jgi:ABC-type Fe3+-hydroxamate transport system substrate-binding protein
MPALFPRHTAAVLLCLSVVACRRADDGALRASADDFGARVPAGTAAHPARIVSLSPATTELLFAIGAGARVVGRTTWDSYPDSARLVMDVGPGLRPNVEAVLARHPDLVVLYASEDNRSADAQLRAAGVTVVALKMDRIESFRRAARLLGLAVGDSARAARVVDSVDATLARVREATAALPHPAVFWHVWDAPIYTIGAGSYLSELLTIAGGNNVYGDIMSPSPQVALEDIVRRDPAVILAGPEGAARIRHEPAWQAVRAVREGHVMVVDTMLVGRPSVRLGEAAVSLANLLHPGVVKR